MVLKASGHQRRCGQKGAAERTVPLEAQIRMKWTRAIDKMYDRDKLLGCGCSNESSCSDGSNQLFSIFRLLQMDIFPALLAKCINRHCSPLYQEPGFLPDVFLKVHKHSINKNWFAKYIGNRLPCNFPLFGLFCRMLLLLCFNSLSDFL